jgi:hypothetical protein
MGNTTLKKANEIPLAFKMSQFFCADIRSTYHFDGNRPKVAEDFFPSRAGEDLRYVLTYLRFFRMVSRNAINANVKLGLARQLASPLVAAQAAAQLQLFAYAVPHRGSSFQEPQTSWQDEWPSFQSR